MSDEAPIFVAVTLNPAWDCTLRIDDPLTFGGVHTIAAETMTAGGKGINVAKMLLANQKLVVATGLIGETDIGRFDENVRAMGMTPRFITVPGQIRTNLMITGSNGEMKFNRSGFPGLALDAVSVRDWVETIAADAGVVILSGSLPAGLPPETYRCLIESIRRRGVATVLDASGDALRLGTSGMPDVIKPNRTELEQLVGRSLSDDAVLEREIRRLCARYAVVIVSDGAHGAWFGSGDQLLRGNSPCVSVIDTTGAGDAMLGQFCADYFTDRCLTATIAAHALAAGAAAVEQAGTPALSIARVQELARQVEVVSL